MSIEDKYKAILPIIEYLFEKWDVASVKIGDPPIEVTRRGEPTIRQQPNQVIQIINSMKADIKIENKVIIEQIIEDLERKGIDSNLVKDAREKLTQLSDEVDKSKPRWNVVKKIILWALEFGKDLFIQLIPLLVRMKL